LVIGDIDRADKTLQEFAIEIRDFIKTPEFDVSEKMVEAYTDGNQAEFDKSAQRSVLNNIFPLNIIKELRKVKVKASTNKKKPEIIEDFAGESEQRYPDYTNASLEHRQTDYTNAASNQEPAQPVVGISEEQKKKELDDFLS